MSGMSTEYVAGFFDGEGSVNIHKRKGHRGCTLYVSIGNTDHAILEQFKAQFGGSVSLLRKQDGNRRPIWKWSTSCNTAVNFLRTIQPYSIIKA